MGQALAEQRDFDSDTGITIRRGPELDSSLRDLQGILQPRIPAPENQVKPIMVADRIKSHLVPDETELMELETITLPQNLTKPSRRIYVLGSNIVGKWIAHSLADIGDRPPITMLFSDDSHVRTWYEEGRLLEVVRDGHAEIHSGFDVEHWSATKTRLSITQIGLARNPQLTYDKGTWLIEKLIIASKFRDTVPLLLSLRKRLGPTSTICFLNSAMEITDEVNAKVFTNPATRPSYMVGFSTHRLVGCSRKFTAITNGSGATYLSLVPKEIQLRSEPNDTTPRISRMDYGWTTSSRSLIKALIRAPALSSTGLPYLEFMLLQWERLAIDAVIGPLSVVFDCQNRCLLNNLAVTNILRGLLSEISTVICSLPELQRKQTLWTKFSPQRLEYLIFQIIAKTGKDISPMLARTRKYQRTDIEYLNGYVIRRGKELGIMCPVNTTIVQMVKAKEMMARYAHEMHIPFRL